jgi:hypothetical protein
MYRLQDQLRCSTGDVGRRHTYCLPEMYQREYLPDDFAVLSYWRQRNDCRIRSSVWLLHTLHLLRDLWEQIVTLGQTETSIGPLPSKAAAVFIA